MARTAKPGAVCTSTHIVGSAARAVTPEPAQPPLHPRSAAAGSAAISVKAINGQPSINPARPLRARKPRTSSMVIAKAMCAIGVGTILPGAFSIASGTPAST